MKLNFTSSYINSKMGHFYSYITRAPPGNSDILPRAKATASENAVAAAEIPKDHINGSPRKSISTDTAVVGALDRILIKNLPENILNRIGTSLQRSRIAFARYHDEGWRS